MSLFTNRLNRDQKLNLNALLVSKLTTYILIFMDLTTQQSIRNSSSKKKSFGLKVIQLRSISLQFVNIQTSYGVNYNNYGQVIIRLVVNQIKRETLICSLSTYLAAIIKIIVLNFGQLSTVRFRIYFIAAISNELKESLIFHKELVQVSIGMKVMLKESFFHWCQLKLLTDCLIQQYTNENINKKYQSLLFIGVFQNLKHQKSQRIGNRLFYQTWSKAVCPSSFSHHFFELLKNQMLGEFMLLIETHGLKFSPHYFERMGYGRCHHSRNHPRQNFIETKGFELLVEHVMKTSKGTFFYAARQSSAEESFKPFSLFDVLYCRKNRTIAMKVGQLKTCFNDVQRISQKGANQS